MKLRNAVAKYSAPLTGAALAGVSSLSMAVGTDFSTITAGLDVSTIVTGVIAAAVLLAGAGFAVWGSKKIGRFFG